MGARLIMSPHYTGNHKLPERFERKFYVAPEQYGLAYGLLHHICARDGDYYSEQINSLYFDTPDLNQHERSSSGDYHKDKIRIRWYGEEPNVGGMQTVFVEMKTRDGFAGTKQRRKMEVPGDALLTGHLYKGIIPIEQLNGILTEFGYYSPDIIIPVVRISYWRHRFNDISTGQRVSLDSHIRSTMIKDSYGNGEKDLELPGAVIEIKGDDMELPETLMNLTLLDTDWSRFSKYSASLDAHTEDKGSYGAFSPSGKIVSYLK